MAKRYNTTEKFKSPFYRGLNASYKLFWDYIQLDCNHAGIWTVEFDIARIYMGKDVVIDEKIAIGVFNKNKERVVVIENGTRWFLPSFIRLQYGELSPGSNSHKSVIEELKKKGVYDKVAHLVKKLSKGKSAPLIDGTLKAKDIIDHLNEKAKKKFMYAKVDMEVICVRLKDGYSVSDLKKVIDNKVLNWLGTSQDQYLRPSTLFRATKINGYLNEDSSTYANGNSFMPKKKSSQHVSKAEEVDSNGW